MKLFRIITSDTASGARRASGLMILLLCCLPLLLAGCPSTVMQSLPWGDKEELKIALSDIELQEIKALETIFLLKVRVMNPNDTATEIRSMKCDLKINGEPFASGLSDERQGLPLLVPSLFPWWCILLNLPLSVLLSKCCKKMSNSTAINLMNH